MVQALAAQDVGHSNLCECTAETNQETSPEARAAHTPTEGTMQTFEVKRQLSQ